MLSQSGLATSTALPIDIRRVPWVRPLAADYVFAYEHLDDFYAGDPRSPKAWQDAIARAQTATRPRAELVRALAAQQERRGAPDGARNAAARLADPSSVAIVTGQQAGVFGGPLFTLLKALTALRLAEQVEREFSVAAVPVFWVDAEDHDWQEVRSCGVLDADLTPHTVTVGDPAGAGERPVAAVVLDAGVEAALAELESRLPATEFTPALLEGLRQAYRPGAGTADAFARWLEALLGPRGLVVHDAADPAVKPLVTRVFVHELEHAGETAGNVARAGEALKARGYHAQLTTQPQAVALFHLDGGRQPVRVDGDTFRVGDTSVPRQTLIDRARSTPEAFSPNVMLRPVVQDALFPTACYVAGPSELAYLAQLRQVYAAAGVPMPLVYQRLSATLVDANVMRFLGRQALPFEQLQAQDEAALNVLLASQLPPGLEAAIDAAGRQLREAMDAVAAGVSGLDPTLEGATRSTLGRMEDDLKKLHGKVIQAAKRKDDTLRRQFRHAQAQAFPAGHPQERQIGAIYFLNKYGPLLIDRLSHEIPLAMGSHWVVAV